MFYNLLNLPKDRAVDFLIFDRLNAFKCQSK